MERAMPLDGFPFGRSILRTVSNLMLAGVVVPPVHTGFGGRDARFLASDVEIRRLLALTTLTPAQLDRVEQLDDWIAFTPAGGLDGAAVKLARLLCPREGLFSGRMLRLNGADEAARRDVARVVTTANRSPGNDSKGRNGR